MKAQFVIPIIASILILGTLGLSQDVFAATITVFNDFASFDADTGLLTEEDFEGLSFCNFDEFDPFSSPCPSPLVIGDVIFTNTGPSGVEVGFCGGCGSTGISVSSTTIVEFPTGPKGVLLMFNGGTSFGGIVTDIDGNTLSFSGAVSNFPTEEPIGFTSTAGIQKIEFTSQELIGRIFLSLPPVTIITISDEASCLAIPGSTFPAPLFCQISSDFTVNAGDTLVIDGVFVFFFGSFTNFGTTEINSSTNSLLQLRSDSINECGGIINANGGSSFSGILNLADSSKLTNKGTINLFGGSGGTSGSLVNNFGTVDNHGTVNENPGSGLNSGIVLNLANFNDGLPDLCVADLSISKTDSQDPVTAGNPLTYALTVNNAGPNDAQNVVVSDILPSGVTLSTVISIPAGCTSLPCNLGTIPNGGSAIVAITVIVNSDTISSLSNTADVTSSTPDPDGTNNSSTTTTDVITSANLSITKTDSPDPVTSGNPLTYTLTVNNAGPSDAQNVVVSDILPSRVTLASVSSSQGGCAALPCNLGTIASDGSAIVTINVTVNLATTGTLTNTASVTSDTDDPDNSNNTATEDTASEAGAPSTPAPPEDPAPPEEPGPPEEAGPPEGAGPPEELVTTETIVNGDFETGTLTGWTKVITGGGSNDWVINDGTLDPFGEFGPLAPISGNFDAMNVQNSIGEQILKQSFTVPTGIVSAQLSWDDRIRTCTFSDPIQEARVQIRDSAGTTVLATVFSTNPGDQLIQIGPNARSFDITSILEPLAEQTVTLAFDYEVRACVSNWSIDNVSLLIEAAAPSTPAPPEPGPPEGAGPP